MTGEGATHEYMGGSSDVEYGRWADVNAFMHMQALQWEPAGQELLAEVGAGEGLRALDVGCGPLGWLRLLSRWVGPAGEVQGTEVTEATAEQARLTVHSEGLSNVTVVVDDVLDSWLPAGSFDLVHARLMLSSVGAPDQQLATYARLLKPGGILVLEEPDSGSWRFNPEAPANQRLVDMAVEVGRMLGRDLDYGRQVRTALRQFEAEPVMRARVLVLPPGHVYRSLPLMFGTLNRDFHAARMGSEAIDGLLAAAERELENPALWCTTFTLVQGFARVGQQPA
jgi:SAM-dependent methyltransferase